MIETNIKEAAGTKTTKINFNYDSNMFQVEGTLTALVLALSGASKVRPSSHYTGASNSFKPADWEFGVVVATDKGNGKEQNNYWYIDNIFMKLYWPTVVFIIVLIMFKHGKIVGIVYMHYLEHIQNTDVWYDAFGFFKAPFIATDYQTGYLVMGNIFIAYTALLAFLYVTLNAWQTEHVGVDNKKTFMGDMIALRGWLTVGIWKKGNPAWTGKYKDNGLYLHNALYYAFKIGFVVSYIGMVLLLTILLVFLTYSSTSDVFNTLYYMYDAELTAAKENNWDEVLKVVAKVADHIF
jgi:hypothetical protein